MYTGGNYRQMAGWSHQLTLRGKRQRGDIKTNH